MSFNKIILVGNLGKDPELRYTPDGTAVCRFSLATSHKEKGESVTTWFKVTLWRKTAKAASKFLTKGSQVYIEGRLSTETWTDREGKQQTSLAVNGSEMQFIGGGERSEPQMTGESPVIEDVPF